MNDDLNVNFMKKHPVFKNENFYKYLMVKSEKLEKIRYKSDMWNDFTK